MKKHDFHILSTSPWPLLLSISAFVTALGAGGLIHGLSYAYFVFPLGVGSTLFVLWRWWYDVIAEAIRDKCFTEIVRKGLRFGFAIMILSETMLFFAFFWSFFKAWLFPAYQLVDFSQKIPTVWPPAGLKTVDPWSIPFFNTVTLLLSGCTVTWAHSLLLMNDTKTASRLLLCTIVLGIIFSVFQGIEYLHAGFSLKDTGLVSIYTSNFYMATGFHGLHVLMGIVSLIVCYIRMLRGKVDANCHIGFECAAWYWHFVDVVWLFLFIFMYVVSA